MHLLYLLLLGKLLVVDERIVESAAFGFLPETLVFRRRAGDALAALLGRLPLLLDVVPALLLLRHARGLKSNPKLVPRLVWVEAAHFACSQLRDVEQKVREAVRYVGEAVEPAKKRC